jgi:hypothetical protein
MENLITKIKEEIPYLENQKKGNFHIFQVNLKSINNLKSTHGSQV